MHPKMQSKTSCGSNLLTESYNQNEWLGSEVKGKVRRALDDRPVLVLIAHWCGWQLQAIPPT